jgi:hypothetical protein
MVTNLSDIKGMDVFDLNGEKVGAIAAVFAVPAFSQNSPPNPSVGTVPPTGEETILKLERGGMMGIGATDLYIPVKDVQTMVLILAPLVALVGWARVELRDHTPTQVTAGAAIGAIIAAIVFTYLR